MRLQRFKSARAGEASNVIEAIATNATVMARLDRETQYSQEPLLDPSAAENRIIRFRG